MIYFVPAWYKENEWSENEQYWYRRKMQSEFDESIKHIQLFHRNLRVDYRILVLGFSPNLRHFLHRQSLYRAPYWSCFDAIQHVTKTKISILSYHNLKWPKGIEFAYSPFAIVAFLNNQKYAQIEFGEDGNMITVDLFENGQVCRKNIYDDRGFISCTILFENGAVKQTDYLDPNGLWVIRIKGEDKRVYVNPKNSYYCMENENGVVEVAFNKDEYNSMPELINEVFHSYVEKCSSDDYFITAIHHLHLAVLHHTLNHHQIIATFFGNRYPLNRLNEIAPYLNRATSIITDTKLCAAKVSEVITQEKVSIKDISPYDSRVDLGVSSQLNIQNIFTPVDGLTAEQFNNLILALARYLKRNKLARVNIFTRNSSWDIDNKYKDVIAKILRENDFDERWVIEKEHMIEAENKIDEMEEEIPELRFFINAFVDERSISKCLNEQRVILDIRNVDDIFLFITAISKGIPRISTNKDQYYAHKENGYFINGTQEAETGLIYYLENLNNWNNALIYCYEYCNEYTTDKLIDTWKEVIKISGRD